MAFEESPTGAPSAWHEGCRSRTVTLCPECRREMAVLRPEIPAPTIIIFNCSMLYLSCENKRFELGVLSVVGVKRPKRKGRGNLIARRKAPRCL